MKIEVFCVKLYTAFTGQYVTQEVERLFTDFTVMYVVNGTWLGLAWHSRGLMLRISQPSSSRNQIAGCPMQDIP